MGGEGGGGEKDGSLMLYTQKWVFFFNSGEVEWCDGVEEVILLERSKRQCARSINFSSLDLLPSPRLQFFQDTAIFLSLHQLPHGPHLLTRLF